MIDLDSELRNNRTEFTVDTHTHTQDININGDCGYNRAATGCSYSPAVTLSHTSSSYPPAACLQTSWKLYSVSLARVCVPAILSLSLSPTVHCYSHLYAFPHQPINDQVLHPNFLKLFVSFFFVLIKFNGGWFSFYLRKFLPVVVLFVTAGGCRSIRNFFAYPLREYPIL